MTAERNELDTTTRAVQPVNAAVVDGAEPMEGPRDDDHAVVEENQRLAGTEAEDAGVRGKDRDEGDSLLEPGDCDAFERRWADVQTRFVDDPHAAVASADTLVSEVMRALAVHFAEQKSSLEGQWSRGNDAETEELRLAMQRYRSFFHRLLSI